MELAPAPRDKHNTGRKRLWCATDNIVDHRIAPEDYRKITAEFLRKVECAKANKPFIPDPAKDSYLSKHYKVAEFDFASTAQRAEYLRSLRCTQIRHQSFFFLDYIKRENAHVARLVEQHAGETDPDQLMCIQELIKKKKINLLYVESIRENISEIICTGEDGVEHFAKCLEILRCN